MCRPRVTHHDGLLQLGDRGAVGAADLGLPDQELQRPAAFREHVGDLRCQRQGVPGVRDRVVGEALFAVQHVPQVHPELGQPGEVGGAPAQPEAEQERRWHGQVGVPGGPRGNDVGVHRVGLADRRGERAQPAALHVHRPGGSSVPITAGSIAAIRRRPSGTA